jgi:hypothetical protein
MTPRRAVLVGILVTFVFGFFLAGYNGTAIYVWYKTGKLESLGSLEDSSSVPIYFAARLVMDFGGFLLGVVLLIAVVAQLAYLGKPLFHNKKKL